MPIIEDVVQGAIKLVGVPERACFRTWQEFIESLPRYLGVEVPASVSGVVVGPDSPSEDDKNKVWFRRDPSGVFLGIYAFQNGAWRPLYNYAPGEVIWIAGDSNAVPAGFTLIEKGDPTMPSDVVNAIVGQYVRVSGDPNSYLYFAVRYSGY